MGWFLVVYGLIRGRVWGKWVPCAALGLPWMTHGVPWMAHGVPWMTHGVPGMTHGVPWMTHGVPWMTHGVPWMTHGVPWMVQGVPWMTHGCPWDFHGRGNGTARGKSGSWRGGGGFQAEGSAGRLDAVFDCVSHPATEADARSGGVQIRNKIPHFLIVGSSVETGGSIESWESPDL
jgi:hypothetical protein